MPYSMEVLVVNQKEYIENPTESKLILEWEGGRLGNLRLNQTWPVLSSISGVWHNIIKKGEVYFDNTALIFETDFDLLLNGNMYYWIKDEERKEFFTPFIIKKEFLDDVRQMLKHLIEQSPIKTLMILPLYEKGAIEIIQGPINFDEYFKLIEKKKIPFNVCTIIKAD